MKRIILASLILLLATSAFAQDRKKIPLIPTDSAITITAAKTLTVTDDATISATPYTPAGTDVAVADGGTGRSAWTLYDIPYASGTTTLVGIPVGTANQILAVNAGANGYNWTTAGAGGGATWTMTADSGTDQLIDTTETVTLKGTSTAGISTTVGATNTWTIVQSKADATTNGYLWSTDFTTFNAKADAGQTFYIGTTQVAINRASAALTLAGITLTTPDIGTPSAGTLTSCTGLPMAGITSSTSANLATLLSDEVGTGKLAFNHKTTVSIVNPNAVVTASAVIPVWTLTDAAITVTKVEVSTSSASYEIADADLKWADVRIGLGNATVINSLVTSSGVLSDSSITAGAVASGKFLYISFGAVPSASMSDCVITITWNYS